MCGFSTFCDAVLCLNWWRLVTSFLKAAAKVRVNLVLISDKVYWCSLIEGDFLHVQRNSPNQILGGLWLDPYIVHTHVPWHYY